MNAGARSHPACIVIYDTWMATLAAAVDEVRLLQTELTAVRAQLEWLKKKLFGGGQGEKLDRAQLLLQIEALEKPAAPAAAQRIAAHERARAQKRVAPAAAFAHLPVAEIREIVPAAVQAEPELYERIGEEETFEVDVVPPQLFKRRIVRPKYRHWLDRNRAPLDGAGEGRGRRLCAMRRNTDPLPGSRCAGPNRAGLAVGRKSPARRHRLPMAQVAAPRRGGFAALGLQSVLQSDAYPAVRRFCPRHRGRHRRGLLGTCPAALPPSARNVAGAGWFVLRLIGSLYAMEAPWDRTGQTGPALRASRRQSDFAPTLSLLKDVAVNLSGRVLSKTPLGEACHYLMAQWESLIAHLHGQTRLDSKRPVRRLVDGSEI